MSKIDNYFQFPIAALRFGKPIDQVTHEEMETRLRAVIDYCIIEVGTAIVERDNHEAIAAQCDRYARENSLKIDMQSEHVKRYLCGASTLGVKAYNVHDQTGLASFKTIEKLASHGGRKQVRLRSDIFLEGVNGKWSWRDLATLCAVYAGIGANQMARLSFDYIAVMALGFSSKDELSAAKQESNRLNRKKTGYTVRTLASRGFFVSASPNYRHVWYSNSMPVIKLATALIAKAESKKTSAISLTKAIIALREKNS